MERGVRLGKVCVSFSEVEGAINHLLAKYSKRGVNVPVNKQVKQEQTVSTCLAARLKRVKYGVDTIVMQLIVRSTVYESLS